MSRFITILGLLALSWQAGAATTAIVNGKIHTVGPQGTIENGTVLIVDGRIAAVGEDVEIPAGAETIDAPEGAAALRVERLEVGALVRVVQEDELAVGEDR